MIGPLCHTVLLSSLLLCLTRIVLSPINLLLHTYISHFAITENFKSFNAYLNEIEYSHTVRHIQYNNTLHTGWLVLLIAVLY